MLIDFLNELQEHKRILESVDFENFKKEERYAYEESLKIYRDNKNVLDTAIDTGIEKGITIGYERGITEGRAEGRAEGILAVARNLKDMGMASQQIAEVTGLTIEEIEKI